LFDLIKAMWHSSFLFKQRQKFGTTDPDELGIAEGGPHQGLRGILPIPGPS